MERLELNISTSFPKIELGEKCLFLGSCFSDEIGNKFKKSKIDTLINPFGVLFHPESLVKLINRAIDQDFFKKTDFFEFQDYWFNYEMSGAMAKFDRNEALEFANENLKKMREYLLSCDRVFITFGSSVERRVNGNIVANCHKQPKNLFERSISSSDSVFFAVKTCLDKLIKVNSKLKIYLTVSPVRHVKEGLVDNQISKANLLIASNNLVKSLNYIEYLPVYEIVIDCLRDYSFFKDDLVHPNSKAVNNVWQLIKANLFTDNFNKFEKELSKFQSAMNHNSLFPKSSAHKRFLSSILATANNIEGKYKIDLSSEKEIINLCLKNLA